MEFAKKAMENPVKSATASIGLIVAIAGALWGMEEHFVNQSEMKVLLMSQFNDKIIELEMELNDKEMTEEARKAIKRFRLEQLRKTVKQMENE